MKNEEHTTVTYMLFLAPFPLVLSSKNTAMHYYSMLPVFDHDVNQVKYRHKVRQNMYAYSHAAATLCPPG